MQQAIAPANGEIPLYAGRLMMAAAIGPVGRLAG
jgi:hypothetical protein